MTYGRPITTGKIPDQNIHTHLHTTMPNMAQIEYELVAQAPILLWIRLPGLPAYVNKSARHKLSSLHSSHYNYNEAHTYS